MKQVSAIRTFILSAAGVALIAGMPAHAQFGGLGSALGALGKKNSAETTTTTAETCPNGKQQSTGAKIFGGIAKSATSRIGGKFASFVPLPEFASLLTGAIACQLDNKEQKQAADATLAVTRGDGTSGEVKVGDTAEWTSSSRKDVKGKSTIVAVDPAPAPPAAKGKGKEKNTQLASASQCITVSDVVIVNGEETTANKKMCRAPGQTRYALMA